MNDRGLERLSAEMESLLAKERNFPEEGAELRARVMTRARVALRDVPTPSTRSFWQRRMPLLVAAALVFAFAAAAIAARQELSGATGQVPNSPPPKGAHPGPAGVTEPGSPAVQGPTNPPKSELPSEQSEQAGVAPPPRRTPAADGSDADALELGLLQRARAAVAAGEFSAALQSIAEHQRRFPAGRLREEREALRIKALAGLGRDDEARRAAERFRERFPRSVLSSRIEETARPKP